MPHSFIARFKHASEFKENCEQYSRNIDSRRQELILVITQHTATVVVHTASAVNNISADISQLRSFMELTSQRERDNKACIFENGGLGAILKASRLTLYENDDRSDIQN
jgi:hypothetical protein